MLQCYAVTQYKKMVSNESKFAATLPSEGARKAFESMPEKEKKRFVEQVEKGREAIATKFGVSRSRQIKSAKATIAEVEARTGEQVPLKEAILSDRERAAVERAEEIKQRFLATGEGLTSSQFRAELAEAGGSSRALKTASRKLRTIGVSPKEAEELTVGKAEGRTFIFKEEVIERPVKEAPEEPEAPREFTGRDLILPSAVPVAPEIFARAVIKREAELRMREQTPIEQKIEDVFLGERGRELPAVVDVVPEKIASGLLTAGEFVGKKTGLERRAVGTFLDIDLPRETVTKVGADLIKTGVLLGPIATTSQIEAQVGAVTTAKVVGDVTREAGKVKILGRFVARAGRGPEQKGFFATVFQKTKDIPQQTFQITKTGKIVELPAAEAGISRTAAATFRRFIRFPTGKIGTEPIKTSVSKEITFGKQIPSRQPEITKTIQFGVGKGPEPSLTVAATRKGITVVRGATDNVRTTGILVETAELKTAIKLSKDLSTTSSAASTSLRQGVQTTSLKQFIQETPKPISNKVTGQITEQIAKVVKRPTFAAPKIKPVVAEITKEVSIQTPVPPTPDITTRVRDLVTTIPTQRTDTVGRTVSITAQVPRVDTIQKAIPTQIGVTRQAISTRTFMTSRQLLTQRFGTGFPTINVPAPKPPKRPPRFPDFRVRGLRRRRRIGDVAVAVRREGKFKTIAEGLTLAKAVEVGKGRVERTLAATFKIIPKRDVGIKTPKGFIRKQEKGTTVFIEKERRRLRTGTEVKEIQLARNIRGIKT